MNRDSFRALSQRHREDAKVLLDAGRYAGAYYLLGYAVECALKACVCRLVGEFDFPDRALAQKAHTHDLDRLLDATGLEQDLESAMRTNPALGFNWSIVKDWSSEARYDAAVSREMARTLYDACTRRRSGVLPWVEARW